MKEDELENDLRELLGKNILRLKMDKDIGFMEIELIESYVMSASKMAALVSLSLNYKIDIQVYPVDADHMNLYMEW